MQFNSVQFNLASTIVFDGGSSFLAFSITEASSTTSIGASLQGLFLVEFLQTQQSTFKISCQIAVIRDTDTQQNVILDTFLKIIIPLAEINQAVCESFG